jgi:hypothetical protein
MISDTPMPKTYSALKYSCMVASKGVLPHAGLLNDADAKTTFLAVPDERLGQGNTVFGEAHIRFLQHTILDQNVEVTSA